MIDPAELDCPALHTPGALSAQDFLATAIALFLIFYLYASTLAAVIIPGSNFPNASQTAVAYISVLTFLWVMAVVSYAWAAFTSPGCVPQWYKDLYPSPQILDASSEAPMKPRWCKHCRAPKSPRTHHCRHCNRCILRMDHHCICNHHMTPRSLDKQLRGLL
jgi:hypothetical protein